MIKFNEANALDIENEKGTLSIEDDIQDGMSLFISNEKIALTMIALLKNDELKKFLENEKHCVIKNTIFSHLHGRKKVVETIFTTVDNFKETETGRKPRIMFISEDTTYEYPLTEEEWTAMVSLMRWVSNGYKE